ncbi:MAG TPA: thiamine-phosphate kinase [Tepidisphaeraceae bacterium]|nr:thiamine-phosphate kinase [Tepidisphaeraceae bacterium]
MAGEFDFIEWIRAQQPLRAPSDFIQVPPGDDLAVLEWMADDLLLVGVDQVLDGVHFDASRHTPRQIGRKAINRNLSDCAAMGCLPAAALATVALPKDASIEYAKELYLGLREAADPYFCPIVGGDTGSWAGKLVLSVTILGRSRGVKPLTRDGAAPGDAIYVTGPLGGSIRGRHMTFEPRVFLGRKLAETGFLTAMIDLSDGLSRDLNHICRMSGVGAVVQATAVPTHDDAVEMRRDGHTPLEHALHDGEDYELLFTAPQGSFGTMGKQIGMITASPGLWLQTDGGLQPLEPRGWEHSL